MRVDFRSALYGAPIMVGVLFVHCLANTNVWNTNLSGNFGDAANWSNGVPGTGDNVFFDRGGGISYVVTFPGQSLFLGPKNYATATASIGSNTVTFAQSLSPALGPSTYTVSSLVMGGPVAAPTILNTSLESLSTGTAMIGVGSNSPGTLNVTGGTFEVTGSTSGYELVIGEGGSGSAMNVQSGAEVNLTGTLTNAVLGDQANVSGTVNVNGIGAIWANASNDPSAPLVIGGSGSGFLSILAGGQVNDFDTDIAHETGSSGSVLVDGSGSIWTNRDELIIGAAGTGSLTVSNGGQVTDNELTVGGSNSGTLTISSGGVVNDSSSGIGGAPSSTGTVHVMGPNSKWTQAQDLRIGGSANLNGMAASGSLSVTQGAHVVTGGDAQIGSVGTGSAVLEDNGTEWSVSGDTSVDAAGSLTVASGAKATTATASVRGNVLISQSGSSWSISDYLELAGQACLGSGCMAPQGTVNVTNGASVTSRVTVVGTEFGSPSVLVDGVGSAWSNSEQMYIGLTGGGNLIVTAGGHVSSNTVEVGVASTGAGIARVDASTWTNSGDLTVGVAGTGKLTISSGGVVTVGGLLAVGPHGTVEGNSQLSGTVRNAGTFAPGIATSPPTSNAIGTLHIQGNYTQTDTGTLDIELASTSSLDRLTISGTASLDGALDVTLFNGFVPSVGNSFDLLTASGGISGAFSSLNPPPLLIGPNGPFWTVVYTPTDVILELVSSLPGDFNHNRVVDAADYVLWRKGLGTTYGQSDYAAWRAHYGQTAGSGSGTVANATVPEPAAAVMWLIFAMFAMCSRSCV